MDSPAVCATICAMSNADESNHTAAATLHDAQCNSVEVRCDEMRSDEISWVIWTLLKADKWQISSCAAAATGKVVSSSERRMLRCYIVNTRQHTLTPALATWTPDNPAPTEWCRKTDRQTHTHTHTHTHTDITLWPSPAEMASVRDEISMGRDTETRRCILGKEILHRHATDHAVINAGFKSLFFDPSLVSNTLSQKGPHSRWHRVL